MDVAGMGGEMVEVWGLGSKPLRDGGNPEAASGVGGGESGEAGA